MRPITVFLSSTYRDSEWRDAARRTIDDMPGFSAVVVEASLATGRAPEGMVLDHILEADIFLIISNSEATGLRSRSTTNPFQNSNTAQRRRRGSRL